jgi:hypothetical protein
MARIATSPVRSIRVFGVEMKNAPNEHSGSPGRSISLRQLKPSTAERRVSSIRLWRGSRVSLPRDGDECAGEHEHESTPENDQRTRQRLLRFASAGLDPSEIEGSNRAGVAAIRPPATERVES